MARPRYPSDEKRLVRPPGINVAFSIRNPDDPEQAKVFDNAELRGVWTGLLLIAGQAFAGRTSDRVTLSAGDLVWLTSRQSRAGAERLLARVCDHMGYELTSDSGRSWTVWVRNLSQNQGWAPQNSAESRAESPQLPPPPNTSTNTSTNTIKKKTASRNGATAPARDRLRSEVRKIWPRCVEAAAKHGRRWETLSDARLTAMTARAKEHGGDVEVLLRAIDGAISYWRASAPEGTDPARNLTPETLYRPANFTKYLEAASDPKIARRKLWSEMTNEERRWWRVENGQLPPESWTPEERERMEGIKCN